MHQRRVRRNLLPLSVSTPLTRGRDHTPADDHHDPLSGDNNTTTTPGATTAHDERPPEALIFDTLSGLASPAKATLPRGTPPRATTTATGEASAKPGLLRQQHQRDGSPPPTKKVRIVEGGVAEVGGPSAGPPAPSARSTPATPLPLEDYSNGEGGGPEVVVVVGPPCSGKTTFAKGSLVAKGYAHVNPDRLGSREKCVGLAAAALRKGQRVVVDNLNCDVETRRLYTQAAAAAGAGSRCIYIDTPVEAAKALSGVRAQRDPSARAVPNDAFTTYSRKFQPPSLAEDFDEILAVRLFPQSGAALQAVG